MEVIFGIIFILVFSFMIGFLPFLFIRGIYRMIKENRLHELPKKIPLPDKTSIFLAIKHLVKRL
ncbi:hypothetical protein APF79_10105 [bacterium BRH_c32]|jgi:hypothetical protein|nr:MAG: hypothetical protein APF79_10105 [bacterium BRH_c32]